MISLGSNNLGIGLAVHLRDQFTRQSRQIESEFNRLHGSANRVMKDNLRVAQALGIAMVGAGIAINRGTRRAVDTFSDFQFTMKTVQLVTEASNQQMARMDELATQLGTNTIFNPQQVASGMEYLGKAGTKVMDILNGNIQAATYLAAALDKQVGGKGGTADFLTHIMKAYEIPATGAMRVADALTKTALSSTADLEDLHEALTHVSGTAHRLGIGLEPTLAMLAKLSDSGLRGSIGGTSLNNMLIQLTSALGSMASKKDRKVLKEMGLDINNIVDAAGNLRPMTDVFREFNRVLAGKGTVEQVSLLNALLNIRGGRAVSPLTKTAPGAKTLSDYLNEINNSRNIAETIALERMNTLWGAFERLRDTIWNFFKVWGSILQPIVEPLVKGLIKLVGLATQFANTPMGKAFLILVSVGGVLLVVLGGLIASIASIKLLTMASTFTFGNMGKSLVAAWSSGAAAALRYLGIAEAAQMVSTPYGPRWRAMSGPNKGRFIKGGAAAAGNLPWLSRLFGGLKVFNMGLLKTTGIFGLLGKFISKFAGPFAVVLTIMNSFVSVWDVIKLLPWALTRLLNAIITGVHVLGAFIMNPVSTLLGQNPNIDKALERHRKASENINKMFFPDWKDESNKTFQNPDKGYWDNIYSDTTKGSFGDRWRRKGEALAKDSTLNNQIMLNEKVLAEWAEEQRKKFAHLRLGTTNISQ